MSEKERQNGFAAPKSGKSLFNFFNFAPKKEAPKTAVKSSETHRRKKMTSRVICIDTDGREVQCREAEGNKMVTEDGRSFSGVIKKTGSDGERIETKYKDGHKIETEIGDDKVKIYTENGTKLNMGRETIQEINVNDSLINSDCKSIVYYDEDIKFARIDFNTGDTPNFAGLEVRQEGIVGGISQTGGKWHTYFSEGGQDIHHEKTDDDRLYRQVKNILKEYRENSLLAENNPIDVIEEQIDGIYNSLK